MNVTLHQLEIFEAIVITGSITKASRVLKLSQPSISQNLFKLEENLGVQLVIRNKKGASVLTPAGEFWHKASFDILERIAHIAKTHEEKYLPSNLKICLGITPTLNGAFVAAAARIAQEGKYYAKFELVNGTNSDQLVEKLQLHQINFAVVTRTALIEEASSYKITKLFEDRIAWAIPSSVSDYEIKHTLMSGSPPSLTHALGRYVDVTQHTITRLEAKDWFSHNFPESIAAFSAPSFANAIELVADGLATSTVTLSLLPNLSPAIVNKVKFFEIQGMKTDVVLAVRKHLMSNSAYSLFYNGLVEHFHNYYSPSIHELKMRKFSDFNSDICDSTIDIE